VSRERRYDVAAAVGIIALIGALAVAKPLPQRRAPARPQTAFMPVQTSSIGPDPTTPSREGYAILITDLEHLRYNLVVNAVELPVPMWSLPEMVSLCNVADGTFPVRIWRSRGDVVQQLATIRVPIVGGGQPWSIPEEPPASSGEWRLGVKTGDTVLIEWNPCVMVAPSQMGGGTTARAMPFASALDRKSQDPVTFESARQPFTVPER